MSLQDLDAWCRAREDQEAFFRRRKAWAREVVKNQGMKPGDYHDEVFERCRFRIQVGPRGGVHLIPMCGRAKMMGWSVPEFRRTMSGENEMAILQLDSVKSFSQP